LDYFQFLNPINHAKDLQAVNRYRIEPYVLAGDIYSVEPNKGRGGWSWYTGAAGWMYRAGVEYILGFQLLGHVLSIKPCVSSEWKKYKIKYQFGKSRYVFNIQITTAVVVHAKKIKLVDDGELHEINLVFDEELDRVDQPLV
jgi:cellobiose phosphorylase